MTFNTALMIKRATFEQATEVEWQYLIAEGHVHICNNTRFVYPASADIAAERLKDTTND